MSPSSRVAAVSSLSSVEQALVRALVAAIVRELRAEDAAGAKDAA